MAGDTYIYIAGDVSPSSTVGKFTAVIIRCVDRNARSICRCSEVASYNIGQYGRAVKGDSRVADRITDLSECVTELFLIRRYLIVAAFRITVDSNVGKTGSIRIVGRYEVHIAVDTVVTRKCITNRCAIVDSNGVDLCLVRIALKSFCIADCSICYVTIKIIAMIWFTIGKHYNNTLAII